MDVTARMWPTSPDSECGLMTAVAEPPPNVTQLELASLKLLREQRDQLDRESQQLRCNILRKLRAGGAVEQGQFGVRVAESQIRKFSRKAIEQVFGPQYVEEIAAHLPASTSTALYVTEPRRDNTSI